MRESHYWLRLTHHAQLAKQVDIAPIIQEAHELVAILTASAKTAKSRSVASSLRTENWATKNKEQGI